MRRGGWGREDGELGGRRRRVFDSGELRLILLKLIADQPRHGYDLIRAIEELSGGVYAPSPGIVYPTLTMLNEMGHIEEASSDGARKAFAITADGSAYLAERKAEVDALLARLAEFATARERTDRGPIRRAMQNLRAVLVNRFERDDVSSETMHQVAAILDEAAQRIEKL
jgi:DNA-binding PadR family transcriptional regulator